MVDPDALRRRARLLKALRAWFDDHGYVEVPTPTAVTSGALEATLDAFEVPGLGQLRTSPEMALKRVLAAGLPRIYELGPCYRDNESGPWHRSEFWMLEWYRAGASLPDLMREVQALVDVAAEAVGAEPVGPWRRASVRALFLESTGLDLARVTTRELSDRDPDWDTAFFRRWIEDVEPRLTGPTFVEAWPASQAAMASVRRDGALPIAERFEVFLGGSELANAFQECVDADALRVRWEAENRERVSRGQPPHPLDEAFLDAVDRMPRTAGIALGVDRLLAVLCGWEGIDRGWP